MSSSQPCYSPPPSRLVPAWQAGRLKPVISADVLKEYVRVLSYPKFKLTDQEIHSLLKTICFHLLMPCRPDPLQSPT